MCVCYGSCWSATPIAWPWDHCRDSRIPRNSLQHSPYHYQNGSGHGYVGLLPEPKRHEGAWWPDWWAIHEAVQRGVFKLSPAEQQIVEAYLHGYRTTQIREWFPSHAVYERTLVRLKKRWEPLEQSIAQLSFPPWGGHDPSPAGLYEEIDPDDHRPQNR